MSTLTNSYQYIWAESDQHPSLHLKHVTKAVVPLLSRGGCSKHTTLKLSKLKYPVVCKMVSVMIQNKMCSGWTCLLLASMDPICHTSSKRTLPLPPWVAGFSMSASTEACLLLWQKDTKDPSYIGGRPRCAHKHACRVRDGAGVSHIPPTGEG